MDAQLKQKAKGRVMTLISKMEELQDLGREDMELNSALPCNLEGFIQEFMRTYTGLEGS